IEGQVEGSITVNGHALTVGLGGHIDAETIADTIVIEGSAKGHLCATTRALIHETANITGNISAPAVAVADGATIHGRIVTGIRQEVPSRMVDNPRTLTSAA